MAWTVIKEDENGNALKTIEQEFIISNIDLIYSGDYKILKYIDPFGDTTFNSLMLDDLISDLTILKSKLSNGFDKIEEIISLANECKSDVHTYLKLYGN